MAMSNIKNVKKSFRIGMKTAGSLLFVAVLVFLLVSLVLAAFSNTTRRLGSESQFQSVTVAGNMSLGNATTDGWILLKPNTGPPTCDGAAEGTLYSKTTDHIIYLCNGTSWGSI